MAHMRQPLECRRRHQQLLEAVLPRSLIRELDADGGSSLNIGNRRTALQAIGAYWGVLGGVIVIAGHRCVLGCARRCNSHKCMPKARDQTPLALTLTVYHCCLAQSRNFMTTGETPADLLL